MFVSDHGTPHDHESLQESAVLTDHRSAGENQEAIDDRKRRHRMARLTIFTIGHSTRPIKVFIRLLKTHGVQRVVDVRAIPRSRHNPQFNRDRLSPALHRVRIHYKHMAGLGGLRHARPDSGNTGWRNASFRGYADYMQTPEFEDSLMRCIELAKHERLVLMCAEAVPWRCHRSLIADALVARGVAVKEITSGVRAQSHVLTPWAHLKGTRLTYPAAIEKTQERTWD
jgi:uncharacterized protein (DUF488 family)